MPVVVLTDSTASLPVDVAQARGIVVVPLQVVIGSDVFDEGSEQASPALVAVALRAGKPVSTSRPTPTAMGEAYAAAARAGATEIVSVHLSGEMSGTVESARLAAREAPVPVVVVDSRQVGVATGFAVLAAADAVRDGADALGAAQAARTCAAETTSVFYVDTLEYLRRGGRIGAAAALVGGALAVKPLLGIEDGVVVGLERVRTTARALARLEEIAVAAAGERSVDVSIAHLASDERAAALAERLAARLAPGLDGRPVRSVEVGPVLGAHVGPGMLAVCIAPGRA